MHYKKNVAERVFDWVNHIALILISLVTVYPIIYVISMSISSQDAVIGLKVRLLPIGFNTSSFVKALQTKGLGLAYMNTIWYVVVGTIIATLVTFMIAYALSRKQFFLRKFLNIFIIITMLFSGGLIPLFMVVKMVGIYNTRWAVVLLSACSVWNLILTRVFIERNIPDSLIESARLDGCNDIRIFYRIVLPLSAQILAIIAMFNAVGYWNQYFTSMVFAPNTSITPLQILLMNILLQGQLQDSAQQSMDPQLAGQRMYYYMQLKYVVILFAIIPIMCAYPFIQKYFVQGVMIGAIKE